MGLSFNVSDRTALTPGLTTEADWLAFARSSLSHTDKDIYAPLPACPQLPMMTARRLNSGSRLAVNCGLEMLRRHPDVDAIVFSSRHGELERNHRILSELATQAPVSPTNFTMSVHNAAVGSLAIIAKSVIPASSVSAGKESFQQGLYEASALLHSGHQCVLFVDFDGIIPGIYHDVLPDGKPFPPYACALILTPGNQWQCSPQPSAGVSVDNNELPQSLQFYCGLISEKRRFTVTGDTHLWHWQNN